MKIWRVRTSRDVTWAASESGGAQLRRIEGELFGAWTLTEEAVADYAVLAPFIPPAIFCVGQNYQAHAVEMDGGNPVANAYPSIFMKNPGAVLDPGLPIQLPRHLRSEKVDYEGELAVIIGRRCRNALPENALNYVLGYTIANDVSARDWQREWGGGQFCRGKSFDSFCPLGPCIATAEGIPSPADLRIRTWVNDEIRQDASTGDMIHAVPELIAFLSGSTTLAPGTVILTGTPSGVGAGMKPPRYLSAGDRVRIGIEGIGELENPVIEEPV